MNHAVATSPAAITAPAAGKSGKDLIGAMRKATALIGKAAKDASPAPVNPKTKDQQPFFAALKKTNKNIKALTKAATAKNDKALQKALGRTGKSVNSMKSAWRLTGVNNAKIADGIKKLDGAYAAYQKNFSKAGLRRKKGGPLSPKETQQAAAPKSKYQASLAPLKAARDRTSKGKFGKSPSARRDHESHRLSIDADRRRRRHERLLLRSDLLRGPVRRLVVRRLVVHGDLRSSLVLGIRDV
ncbi:MAG: hypothetical protein IPF82_00185 [Blastocatellia bacterium]|nr:hypothetical protein [Blastocatellia bacterium]